MPVPLRYTYTHQAASLAPAVSVLLRLTWGKDGNRGFERGMELRRLEEEDMEALQPLRRGWCIGSAEFREQMLEKIGPQVGDSHSGELRLESAASKARRIIVEELKRLGWTGQDLVRRRKSDPGKLRLRRD